MTDEDRTHYYQRATTWALDEQEATLKSRGRSRFIAGVAVVVAILEAFALMLLAPLKTATVVPLLVDRQTGFVQVLRPDGVQALEASKALTNSLLVQYVTAREGYNITDVSAEYHQVALWSAGPALQDYVAQMQASNPASPVRLYPRTTLIETRVESVSPLGPHAALVRFATRRHDQDAQPSSPQLWAAVINYRFSDEALTASDRWLNPLGFKVIGYHRDAEAPLPIDADERDSAGSPTSNATIAPGNSASLPTAVSPPIPAAPLKHRP